MHTILQIWSTGYCGSSILNLLLDWFEGVRGLGEIERVLHPKLYKPCSICQKSSNDSVTDCHFYDGCSAKFFYCDCFNRYRDATILVDATKSVKFATERIENERWFSYKRVILNKYPHEFAHSASKHNKWSATQGFEFWIYANNLRESMNCNIDTINLSYCNLMSDVDQELQKIVKWAGESGEKRRENWWETDTHIIGGNTLVRAQINPHYEIAFDLYNKYNDKKGKLFKDEFWKTDSKFVAESVSCYDLLKYRLDPILKSLDMPNSESLAKDIKQYHFKTFM